MASAVDSITALVKQGSVIVARKREDVYSTERQSVPAVVSNNYSVTLMSEPTPAFRFSRLITVVASDIDELNHVNNVQYVQYVQDTAAAHWLTAIPEGEREQYIWVVLEHRIRYHKPAFLGEELRCTTWVGEVRGPSPSASYASSGPPITCCSAKPKPNGCSWTRSRNGPSAWKRT
ncbi:acyl-CoA thioesterase [Hymenobacter qilianensis]|uniref:Acyl-CoA thioesterase n=1 Tax=Hymenobacter qilianensis TaxID=1385715 RepID=A0A7H0GTU0_9BACT|nr:acyl-CoA thioesterase [Hymenobacter qilianensis]QNP51706.1 acyl-CoA thioesterase [Hymenobacter qilianensis]